MLIIFGNATYNDATHKLSFVVLHSSLISETIIQHLKVQVTWFNSRATHKMLFNPKEQYQKDTQYKSRDAFATCKNSNNNCNRHLLYSNRKMSGAGNVEASLENLSSGWSYGSDSGYITKFMIWWILSTHFVSLWYTLLTLSLNNTMGITISPTSYHANPIN